MARPAPTPPRPKFVRHALRPEWGIGCVIDVFSGLIRVRFADGPYGGYQAIMVNPHGGYIGASESRKDGQAAGY